MCRKSRLGVIKDRVMVWLINVNYMKRYYFQYNFMLSLHDTTTHTYQRVYCNLHAQGSFVSSMVSFGIKLNYYRYF